MAMYESDLTKFMREYLKAHPEELESQRKGRGVWWDKDLATRTPPVPVQHPPKAGGSEYLFEALSESDRDKK